MIFKKSEENRKKQYYQNLLYKIDENIWDKELRIATVKEIREGIRREYDRMSEAVRALEAQIVKLQEAEKKDYDEIKKLTEQKTVWQADIDKMREQMMGKWVESEAKYVGGIDEETKALEQKIKGGREFQGFIKKHFLK